MSKQRPATKRTNEPRTAAKPEKRLRLFPIIVTSVILAGYGYFLAHPVNLTSGDLGRHLKNGELFIQSQLVARTNLFSYTFPDRPFVNHHWGSGVIFYLIERAFGFVGLSLAFIALSLLTLFIFFTLATKYSSFILAALLTVIAIPVLITRDEIRPELFSYLLSGVFLYILWSYKYRKLGVGWLYLLPILELLWVNLHIYFFIGILLIGVFLFEFAVEFFINRSQVHGAQLKSLAFVWLLAGLVSCLNPAGIEGALYPFLIFNEYEFSVNENYSVRAVLQAGFNFHPLPYFLIQFGLLSLSWIYVAATDRMNFSLGNLLLSVIFSALAWWGIRNFALFAYFALPLTAINFKTLLQRQFATSLSNAPLKSSVVLAATAALLILIDPDHFFNPGRGGVGVGLKEGNPAAAEFFLRENLQGPIFNNYDVGGYLIQHLYPRHRVFVDNRPETYPAEFFRDVYSPMQRNDEQWASINNKFGFNAIVFNYHDLSTWAERFIVRRVLDPAWAPVFFDDDIVILLKRFGPNQSTIAKHELPKDKILARAD